MSPRPLLVVTTSFPRHPADPAGSFVAGQVRALRDQGFPVRVLVAPRRPDSTGWPEALDAAPALNAARGVSVTARLLARLQRAARPDDTVVVHWLVPCGLAATTLPNPVVAWAHGGDVALLERLPVGGWVARRLATRMTRIAFVSEDLRARFQRLAGPRRPSSSRLTADLVVAPMGVERPAPDPDAVARYRALARGRRVLATVGRQVPVKGLDVLEAAIRGRDDLLWLAAGEGPARPQAAHALGLLDPPRRDALLQAADVLVHPSRSIRGRTEGAPLAVMEAAAAGLPVVASDTGGVREVARNARLVPPEDPAALLQGIDAALAASRPMPDPRYTWPVVAQDHARLLQVANP